MFSYCWFILFKTFIILFLLSCQNKNYHALDNAEKNNVEIYSTRNQSSNSNSLNKEEFDDFLDKFCDDSNFQKARTKFPFLDITFSQTKANDSIKSFINENKWQHLGLIMEEKYIIQKYDNFECKLRDTDERVLAYQGIGNEIANYYFFKRINGLWYLIKRVSSAQDQEIEN